MPLTTDDHDHHRSLIVGGKVANDGDYPSFAWTGIKDGVGWGCGGVLIHDDIVMTAAHCQWVMGEGVYIGSSRLSKEFDGGNGQFYNTSSMLVHPEYNDTLHQNDILLVKLDGNAATSSSKTKTKPIQWNTNTNLPQDDDLVRVIGFGTTSEGGNFSRDLRYVDVNAVSTTKCADIWKQERQLPILEEFHLCAGTTQGGKDACDSDSGSPLFYVSPENNQIISVVGIVGDGIGCGKPNKPALYTRVSTFSEWIESSICNISSYPPKHDCSMYNNSTITTSASDNNDMVIEKHHNHLGELLGTAIGVVILTYVLYKLFCRCFLTRRRGYKDIPDQQFLTV